MKKICKKHPELDGLRLTPGPGRKTGRCVACNRESGAKYYEANKDRIRAKHIEYGASNRESQKIRSREWVKNNRERHNARVREWNRRNPEKMRAMSASWAKSNPEKAAALAAQYRAAKLQATPAWADKFLISEAYDLAARRTQMRSGGVKWHVDHIVPLNHPLVCGLHVERNMQVIPATANCRKGNRHWPDMSDETTVAPGDTVSCSSLTYTALPA